MCTDMYTEAGHLSTPIPPRPWKDSAFLAALHWGMAGYVVLFDSQRKIPNKTHHFTAEFTVIFRNSFFEELMIG